MVSCAAFVTLQELIMSLSKNDVEKIAKLARLQVDENEIDQYAQTLSRILNLVEQMNSVNTDNVQPMSHPRDATLRLRPDEVKETNHRDEFQAVAPATENGLYLVPKVIE